MDRQGASAAVSVAVAFAFATPAAANLAGLDSCCVAAAIFAAACARVPGHCSGFALGFNCMTALGFDCIKLLDVEGCDISPDSVAELL